MNSVEPTRKTMVVNVVSLLTYFCSVYNCKKRFMTRFFYSFKMCIFCMWTRSKMKIIINPCLLGNSYIIKLNKKWLSSLSLCRSFNPFFPLLECFHTPGVQLWAAWAMQHVCSKNGESQTPQSESCRAFGTICQISDSRVTRVSAAARYCSMLLEEGGMQQLEHVHAHPQTHRDVRLLAESILESLRRHRARTGQPALSIAGRRPPAQ